MSKITRVTNKIFASDAAADEIGQFGSAVEGSKLETSDVATIQALDSWLDGWSEALVSGNRYPTLQELNGALKVQSYQSAYLAQEGIAEYDSASTYYIGSIVKKTGTFELYGSLIDDNVGNTLIDGSNWQFLMDLSDGIPEVDYVDYTTYSVNSATVDSDGHADFIARVSDTELSFDMTLPITRTFTDGSQQTVTTTPNITGISADGFYNIIKRKGSDPITTTVTITEDYTKPTAPSTGDLHTDISVKPFKQYEYNGATWDLLSGDDLFVKDGQVTKASGVILEADVISYALNGKYYIDTNTNPALSLLLSKNHNIGTTKILTRCKMRCVIADNGYVAGEYIQNFSAYKSYATSANLPFYDSLKMNIKFSNSIVIIPRADTGEANGALTLANWTVIFEAERTF